MGEQLPLLPYVMPYENAHTVDLPRLAVAGHGPASRSSATSIRSPLALPFDRADPPALYAFNFR